MSQDTTATPSDPTDADPAARLEKLEQDVQSYRISRDTWTLLALGLAFLVVIGSIIAIGVAQRDDGSGGQAAAGAGEGAAAAPAQAQTITADLTEFAIVLSSPEIAPGGKIQVVNNGTQQHNLGVEGTDLLSETIAGGATTTLDISSLPAGTYTLFCEIPGHADSGMRTPLVIAEGAQPAAAGAADSDAAAMGMTPAEHAAMTEEEGAALDEVMLASITPFLDTITSGEPLTEGLGNQPIEPEILPDGTKHFELTAEIIDWEVSPGEIVQAWAYNGQVPGPRFDLEVGDRIQVELTNRLPLGTDIHWHGIDTPNDQDGVAGITQELVRSGETYTYEFTVSEAAIGMYHAHSHGEQAIPNGLFGTMYVGEMPLPAGQTISGIEVPEDVEITHDFPMVVNDAGVIGLTLNGKSFPATEALFMDVGEWATVTYYNEGLQVHPMHLHGFEQIVIAKDGEPLDQPYAADTILVAPGERYTVIFEADRPGAWVWHCHIINHAESSEGLFGMVTAVIVTDPDAAPAGTEAPADTAASAGTEAPATTGG